MTTSSSRFSELYSAYAAGCLDPAFALMVETQCMIRQDIRDSIALSEMISGSFLELAEPANISEQAISRVMAAIDGMDAPVETNLKAGKAAGLAINELLSLPEPLRATALDAAGKRGWQKMGLGLKRLPLDLDTSMDAELYRIAPGSKIPRHSHGGTEYTLVIAGGFRDEHGGYGPGDVAVIDGALSHQPVADDDEVCLALVIRDGGLRFEGMMGVVQRLIGGH